MCKSMCIVFSLYIYIRGDQSKSIRSTSLSWTKAREDIGPRHPFILVQDKCPFILIVVFILKQKIFHEEINQKELPICVST